MKTSRSLVFALRSIACCAAVSGSAGFGLVACGSDDDDDGSGSGAASGAGAMGGTTGGSAGRGGGGGAGSGGRGGTAGTGASGGSDAGSGGGGNSDAGQGGAGTAGTSGGSAGAAGEDGAAGETSAGGSPGSGGGVADAGESGAGGSGGGSGGGTIESCFDGLRALEGTSQISTRENVGEQIRLRLALETADRIGTSGTYPWAPVRLALEIDGMLICLDESALANAYDGTHHNCTDSLSFDHDGLSYDIGSPDSRGLEDATLTVSSDGSVVRGPVTLTATECVAGGGVSAECRSGGPC